MLPPHVLPPRVLPPRVLPPRVLPPRVLPPRVPDRQGACLMTSPSDFVAGGLLVLLYSAAVLLSGYVVVVMARLFSTNRAWRGAAVIVFGAAQLRFIVDSPMSTVIESMNVTHVLMGQSRNDVPVVAVAEICLLRPLEGMVTNANVPLQTVMSTLSTVSAVRQLELTYDEIATRGALTPAMRNSWRYFFSSSGEGYFPPFPQSSSTTVPSGGEITTLPTGGFPPFSPPSSGADISSSVRQSPVHHDFNLGRGRGGARDDDHDAAAGRVEGETLYTAPASAVLVEGNAWHFGMDGRPYYAIWAKPSGRQKSGRHLIKCGLAYPTHVTNSWTTRRGPFS